MRMFVLPIMSPTSQHWSSNPQVIMVATVSLTTAKTSTSISCGAQERKTLRHKLHDGGLHEEKLEIKLVAFSEGFSEQWH